MSAGGPGASGWRGQSRRRDTPLAALRERRALSRRSATRWASRARPSAARAAASPAPRRTAVPASGVPPLGVQPRRPARSWWPWLAAGLAMLTLTAALAWVLLGSSLFVARSVQVVGTRELPARVVRAMAAVRLGTPMMRLDTHAVEARVAALPRVASVQVQCRLDGTVRIEVTERTPVAFVHRGNGVQLVDATGTDYATVPVGPPGLPELRVARVGPRDAATVAALTVLTELPEWLRVQVRSIAAASPADVVLELGKGRGGTTREIRWGGVEEGERKAAILGPLLTQPGRTYNVSSPALPTIA
ncbi:MAG: FtsQ-type POTRA domain-containing protein [Pseudonocardiales bacterium]|nr:FtsQ-type POTRA domain-containing protein [Pseudonocardiales bacterium]